MALESRLQFAPRVRAHLAVSGIRFIVTGAGGWFGLATLEMLEDALGAAFERRVTVYARTARDLVMRSGRRIRLRPLSDLRNEANSNGDICMANYAFLTREKAALNNAYIATNRDLTTFTAAQAQRLGLAGVFSTSSGAVYRLDRTLHDDLESYPYSVLKLEEEAASARLQERGAAAAICRVFNVAGPFINKDYALGSLLRDAYFAPALTIRAQHRVYRSYAHIGDIISVGFAAMTRLVAAPGAPYDTAGTEVVEVGDLATRILQVLDRCEKPILRGPPSDAPDDRYVGHGPTFAELARRSGFDLATLDQQILDTGRYIESRGAAPKP
ncbi:NAD(P)-dependent oxidoreductase [Beijerinckia sp. L45]|uniref:NAD-dependent epimerase/dehydratase family protein n=1 Tax=Beijerinckia sp. L45 TaxID=1641855 RepID=UPI00131DABFC|nr:NAD-dependent epimerase/dehydratase family protein [Beijerinckia sp. L45]